MDHTEFIHFKPIPDESTSSPEQNTVDETKRRRTSRDEWDHVFTNAIQALICELREKVRELQNENEKLRYSLTRKYAHVRKLRETIVNMEHSVHKQDEELFSQSSPAPEGITETVAESSLVQPVTAYADNEAGWNTTIEGQYDPTMDLGFSPDSDLSAFLNRPIRSRVDTWAVSQPLFFSFNPWVDFLSNPFVLNKISNFELIRMRLHVKVVISGTKFHYGRGIVSYNPLSGLDDVTVQRNFLVADLVAASQKPHFFIDPTKNAGGQIELPFFWTDNFMSLVRQDYNLMGTITVASFGNLLHANSGNDPVTISTYIWADDVKLCMPTHLLPGGISPSSELPILDSQAMNSDEYGQGIISKPAATTALVAGFLKSLPYIGPFAKSTEMVATAVAGIARIFGYSRPNVITDIQLYKPLPFGNLANVDACDAAMKLSMDTKTELTIDSRTVGLDGSDQMGITDIVCRESFLGSFGWNSNEAPDVLLWSAGVSPMLYSTVDKEIHCTPMAYMSQMFYWWQGTIKFRFQIVKSDFHKGRLLVRYDPLQHDPAVEYNINYSRVVDISEHDDFEIEIGWAQRSPWLSTAPLTNVNHSSTTRQTFKNYLNGVLEVNVLNELVSPAEDSPISVNVFVCMCDDAKFAAPTNAAINDLHFFPEPSPALPSQASVPLMPGRGGFIWPWDDARDNVEERTINSGEGTLVLTESDFRSAATSTSKMSVLQWDVTQFPNLSKVEGIFFVDDDTEAAAALDGRIEIYPVSSSVFLEHGLPYDSNAFDNLSVGEWTTWLNRLSSRFWGKVGAPVPNSPTAIASFSATGDFTNPVDLTEMYVETLRQDLDFFTIVLVSPSSEFDTIGDELRIRTGENDNSSAPVLRFTFFEPQTSMLFSQSSPPDTADCPTGGNPIQPISKCADPTDHTYDVFFGDPPTTLRSMFKRYIKTRHWVVPSTGSSDGAIIVLSNADQPYFTGWDTVGIDTASDVTTPCTLGSTHFSSYWQPCYAGMRGGRRKKYYLTGFNEETPVIVRSNSDSTTGRWSIKTFPLNLATRDAQAILSTDGAIRSGNGALVTNAGTNDTLEVELPFYSSKRMVSARNIGAAKLPTNTHNITTYKYIIDDKFKTIQQWDATAEDFSLFFFTGCPILFKYKLDETS
eukprot:GHVL01037766.1.p1 GENE.GHVL01037766.1~~GHVL01037766.1.p1  ORF type:complete len:1142 (-),score=132.77 GHVL01037766.1:176-3601(-)